MKPMKNPILHEIFPESDFSWNQRRVKFCLKLWKMRFFMKSMKKNLFPEVFPKSISSGSREECNSSWDPCKMRFFMAQWQNLVFVWPAEYAILHDVDENAILHGILEQWDCSSSLWRKKLPTQAKGTAISHETHGKCSSSWDPWRIQFIMSPVRKAILDEILPCRKQFCMKPTQKSWNPRKTQFFIKLRDTCCSSWSSPNQLSTKPTRGALFKKSVKNAILHESPKERNSSWNPWRMHFFMKSFRKATFHENNGEWNSASNYARLQFFMKSMKNSVFHEVFPK